MLHSPVLITLAIYYAVILLIGVYTSKSNKNLSDFVLGGRNLGSTMAALGAGASDMSGWLLLALPGAVYVAGISQIWMPIGLILGAYCNWFFVAKRLRIYTEIANDSLTIPAYLEQRFHDKSQLLRSVTALTILIFFTIYAAAGFVSSAVLFTSTFDISYHSALLIGTSVIVLYTTFGGFLAVNRVDLMQGILMLFALLLVPIVTLSALGGWQATVTNITQQGAEFTQIFRESSTQQLNLIAILSLLGWGLGYFGQPHILVRFMAAKTANHIPPARRICMTWMILSLLGAILCGFVGIAYFPNNSLAIPSSVFLELAYELFNPWLFGLLFAAVLSAIMSTISAQLLASASALTEDFYHHFIRPNESDQESVFVSRMCVIVVAIVAVIIAYNPDNSILDLVSYAWAGLGASFGPVILLSLYWPKMSRNSALVGIIVGALTVFIWPLLSSLAPLFELYELIPGFCFSTLAIIISNALTRDNQQTKQQIANDYAQVQQQLGKNTPV